jgi:2-polyprenyl-6-methoxyphenol hydroxylase-like FAD-dependent oxidoreductase
MHVLISGAGVAGPTLAFFLAKAGINSTILEKCHITLAHGQNIDFKGSAITIIKKMGLMDEVRKANTTEKGTHFIDPAGQPFAPFPVKFNGDRSASLTSEFEILRGDLATLLHAATKDHPRIKYLFGTTIKEVISNNEKAVKVELSNKQVLEFDLLVAADGQWSKLRKQCFPPEDVKALHQGMYAVYYTVPRLPSDNDWWNVYVALRSRIITLRPDNHNTIRAMFTLMPCNSEQEAEWAEASRSGRKVQEELLQRDFDDAGWQAKRLLADVDRTPDFYFHAISQIRMAKWSNSRIVCLGDTAYAPTPLTGMGTSLAIIGAYVLAGELSKLSNGEHPLRALEAYESEFRPFVEEMQKIPPFIPAIAHPHTAWRRWLLNSFVSLLSKVVAMPWIANRSSSAEDADGFALPHYSAITESSSEV